MAQSGIFKLSRKKVERQLYIGSEGAEGNTWEFFLSHNSWQIAKIQKDLSITKSTQNSEMYAFRNGFGIFNSHPFPNNLMYHQQLRVFEGK